jgi:hypothetical protein
MVFVRPTNTVLVGGNPIVEEGLVTEGATCKARLFVKKGTADHQVTLAGDGEKKPLGILDREKNIPIADAFPDKQTVRVMKAPAVVVGILASGNNALKGQPLVCATGGKLKLAADIAVSVPAGATTVTSTAAQPDLTEIGSIPPYGVIVAFAEESVDASAEDKPIMVRLVI